MNAVLVNWRNDAGDMIVTVGWVAEDNGQELTVCSDVGDMIVTVGWVAEDNAQGFSM